MQFAEVSFPVTKNMSLSESGFRSNITNNIGFVIIGVSKIIIAYGRTDLKKSIDGLALLVGTKYDMNPFEKMFSFFFVVDTVTELKQPFDPAGTLSTE